MKIPQNSKKVHKSFVACKLLPTFARFFERRKDARVVEEARLESV